VNNRAKIRPALHRGALFASLAILGCSGPGEDVRVTLCKDMVSTRLGPAQSPTWTDVRTETRGYEHAAVRLRFSTGAGDGEASCFYDYNAVEDTALALADPLSAYATSPSKMTLNGETLSKSQLADAVKKAMLKQGRDLLSGSR
jgi:hypothetical protein